MTLASFLAARNIRLTDFAATLGVGVTTLHGYVSGRRSPPVAIVAKIEAETDGLVRAADFLAETARDAAA